MNIPLWYQVDSRQLDLNQFLDRYNHPEIYHEKEVLPIFLSMLLRQRNLYIDKGHHILFEFFSDRGITDRALKYIYIYLAWGYHLSKEELILGQADLGTFQKYNFSLPNEFDHDYLIQWIVSMVKSMLGLRIVGPSIHPYIPGSFDQLNQALAYRELLKSRNMILTEPTIEKLFRLSQADQALTQLKGFFEGTTCPDYLRICRDDSTYFRIITQQYCPVVLKSLYSLAPKSADQETQPPMIQDEPGSTPDESRIYGWSTVESRIIQQAHRKLCEKGDIGFFLDYVDLFQETFPSDDLTRQLIAMSRPCPEKDNLRMNQHLLKLTPLDRSRLLPLWMPLSDHGVITLVEQVKRNGFGPSFQTWLHRYRQTILEEWAQSGTEICNDRVFSTGESIWAYPHHELVFYSEGKNGYVFTRSELFNLKDDPKNPYNRSTLPNYLMDQAHPEDSLTYAEIWSKILRRSLDLSELI